MKAFLSILLLVPASIFAQQKFNIKGNLKGLPDGTPVSLSNANKPEDTVAKSTVKDGIFQLSGSIAEANLYQLNLDAAQKKSILFIGNDNVNVDGDVNAIQDLAITGSPTHDAFEDFKKTFNPLFKDLTTLGQQINAQPDTKPDDSIMVAYKSKIDDVKSAVDQFVNAHKSSPVAPFAMVVTSEIDQDIPALEKRYKLLNKDAQTGFFGMIIQQQISDSRTGAIGSQAMDFTQPDVNGKSVALTSFKGKYVLLDFWASWCRPCRMENPNVVKAYNKYKDKNFTVLGVSLDRDKSPWLKAIKDDKLVWTQVSDLKFWYNDVATKYKIQSIPQNYLLDPTGKIIAKNLRGDELTSKLNELLGDK
ncbi:MAG: TlpA disulfide reductase family protein [Flavitalea sp.]